MLAELFGDCDLMSGGKCDCRSLISSDVSEALCFSYSLSSPFEVQREREFNMVYINS